MMNKVWWALIALVVFTLFLIVSMPARFALQFVDLPAGVQVGGVTGSVWRGEVDAVRADTIMLRDVQWRVRPLALLGGRFQVDLEIGEHVDNLVVGKGTLALGRSQTQISRLLLEARLNDLAAFAPQPSPFPLRGDVQLQIDDLALGQPLCRQAQGQVELRGGAMQVGPTWEDLGELQATLGCDDGWLTAELMPNHLGLTAAIRLTSQQAQGQFQIHVSEQAPRSVRNLVAMLPEQARRVQRFAIQF